MNRVYRLLRNNIESGPFTIDELLGQELKSTDMLWIEGQSTAWCYLTELELSLTTAKKEKPSAPPKSVKKSGPRTLEEKADEIRKKVLAYQPRHLPVVEEIVDRNEKHVYIPLDEKDTIELIDHRRQKSTMLNDVLMTAVIVALFAGGLYGGQAMFAPKNKTLTPVQQAQNNTQHAAKAVVIADSADTPATDSSTLLATRLSADSTARKTEWQAKTVLNENKFAEAIEKTEETLPETALAESTFKRVEPIVDPKAIEGEKEIKPKETQKVNEETKPRDKEIKATNKQDQEEETDKTEKKGFFKKLFGKKKKSDKADEETKD